jgi:WD40 repeat protein/tRNA A-37 threonylcarbamoyl transferase component Bud32
MSEQAIFLAALDKEPAERAAFLDEACAGNETLRHGVETLLRLHAAPHHFLEVPVVEQLAAVTLDARPEDLSFLAPSGEPGSLGRLDHYEILEVIGRGGTGVVLRARDTKLLRIVALKVLAAPLAVSGTARQRFAREARAAAAVRDEHVIDIHAVRDDAPAPYLVMEYIDGCNLETLLRKGGSLEVREILRIGMQVASGLAAAHRLGLVHRDVKPANILLENGVQRVKLTDFGLARAADDASLTQTGFIAGTPLYMAPEQAAGELIDARADLFSLGSVLYELCTGRPAFRAPTTVAVIRRVCDETPRPIREVNPDIPEVVCQVIERLHAKKPGDRPASAQEVAELLARLLADLQQPNSVGHVSNVPAQKARWKRAPRRWFWAAAALVLVAAGLGMSEATGVTDVRGTVIRLISPEGTLVVEVDDPGVSVVVDGGDVVITGAGAKEIRLRPGQYKVEASKDGKVVRQELVMVTRNGRQVVRISKEAAPLEKSVVPAPAAKLKKSLLGHTQSVNNVAYSPDGRLLASSDEAGEVRVWDMPGGTLRYVLPVRGPKVHALTFSPDGKSLLTGAVVDEGPGDINVWEAKTGKPDGVLKGHTKGANEVSFGPGGQTLVSAGWDATVRVWDFAARREVRVIPAPDGQWIRSVVLSAGGKVAVGGGENGKVFLLGLDGKLVKAFDTSAGPVCFSPDGRLLAGTTWRQGLVTVWDVNSGERVGAWRAHEGLANGVQFSRDGRVLATAGSDGAVRFWDVATQRQLSELRQEGDAYQLAFSPDGQSLATTGRENRLVKLWDVSFLRSLKPPQKSN